MAARIEELAAAVVTAIQAAWSPTGSDGVSWDYAPEINQSGAEGTPLAGRQVYVIPGEYGSSLIDRGEYGKRAVLGIIIVERHTDAGAPPRSWVSTRVQFVQDKVVNVLRDPTVHLAADATHSGFVPDYLDGDGAEPVGVDEVADRDALTGPKGKAFWSVVTARFRELEAV